MSDQPIGGTDMPLFTEAPTLAPPAQMRREPRRRRGFAGFSWGQILLGGLMIAAAGWGIWLTREFLIVRDKRIVSVSLAAMANDFVMAEARAANSPEQTQADTGHYMSALQKVLKDRAARGETILVSEAVVSSSVPDMTPEVRAAVGKLITANPPPRVPATPLVAPTTQPTSPALGMPRFASPASPPTANAMGAADGAAGN